jgi:hypothetical protein
LITRWQLVFGAAFLATGAALVTYIASGISLWLTALGASAIAGLTTRAIWRRLNESRRLLLKQRLISGLIAGLIATAAYDLSRFALIEITGIRFWPFDVFRVFGQALMGSAFGDGMTRTAGFLYHVANGLGFGVTYAVWMGERGISAGIGFAMLAVSPVVVEIRFFGIRA